MIKLGKGKQQNMTQNFYSTTEAASFLKISKSTLYKLVEKRAISHYKPNGGKIYFKDDDLIEFIESSRIDTRAEIEIQAQKYISEMDRVSKNTKT